MHDHLTPPRDDATPALDRATVEALITSASEMASDIGYEANCEGSQEKADTSALLSRLEAALWALLREQEILTNNVAQAFEANGKLGASNDELRLRVGRLTFALKKIAHMEIPHAQAMDATMREIARTALEGSSGRG